MAIYQVLRHLDISAIIDLNKRSTGHIQQQGEFTFTPEDSAYGRVFYTYEADNLRYFTRIPRKSKAWKERYKRRTTVERTNKRLKEDYGLENKKRRNTRDWYIEAFLTAMCLHIDAWVKHDGINMTSLIDQWAAPFRQ
ncbi:hypothetical protein J2S00_003944 [Caldalkalibacillus uzonensis]|uniref:Transposase IS4-like domain-containing protein n=2 Tax=Caldalkalibacillus uzonensis TaxID=353224 RepID=A0ABU0CY78_9BACI|nr:hypothetical protein [Caldalkalibacillus uzonensis]